MAFQKLSPLVPNRSHESMHSQLLGVVLSLMSLPMSSPKDSMMAEILFHSSFSSKGDKMERLPPLSVDCRFSFET